MRTRLESIEYEGRWDMNPLPPWWEMQCEDFYLHCELNEDYNDVTLTHHTTDGN